jgi:predicted metalloprotease with PDZ domain
MGRLTPRAGRKFRRVLINVTANHIRYGSFINCTKCPIAKAIHAVTRSGVTVMADEERITFTLKVKGKYYFDFSYQVQDVKTPLTAKKFILAIDGGVPKKELNPFSFYLDVPIQFLP